MRCPICDMEIDKGRSERVVISKYNNQRYELYHCDNCHLKFWWPLRIIQEFYENETFGYHEFHQGMRSELEPNHRAFFKHFPLRRGSLLDVGCGDGIFLKAAQDMGFEVYGIDFDRKSVETASNRFGLNNVYSMSLDEFKDYARGKDLRFDVITFFEVLEHQDDPKRFLKNIKQLLRTGGYVAGSVPNRERFLAGLERHTSTWDLPPHHFLWFSRNILSYFLEKEGFSEVEFSDVNYRFSEVSLLGMNFLRPLILKIKRLVLKSEQKAELSIEALRNLEGNTLKVRFLNMIRVLYNILFSPVIATLWFAYNLNGYGIYFQARIRA